MRDLFLTVLNMGLTASYIIAVVVLARLALRKAPRVFSYALWAVVLFRLLCPFTIPSPVSVVPSSQPIPPEVVEPPTFYIDSGVPAIDTPVNGYLGGHHFEGAALAPTGFKADFLGIAAVVWAAGAVLLLGYTAASLLRLRWKLVGWVPLSGEKNVRLADHIPSPFVLGLAFPKIYLPSGLPENERDYILLHERTHIRRGDHVFRALAWLAVAAHWFNPLVWLAFHLAGKDMEMSCDEAVLRKMGRDVRADYSASLLRLSAGKRLSVGPLAFGDGDPQGRIKNVLGWKKPALWVVVAALAAVVCTGAVLATDRGAVSDSPEPPPFEFHDPGLTELWVDYLEHPEEMPWDGSAEIQLPEYPGVTFRWTANQVSAITDSDDPMMMDGPLLWGMPVWNAYFCDLDGDGFRELYATVSFGSGMTDSRIRMFNYKYLSSWELEDRGVHDYSLRMEGGQLWAVERDYQSGEVTREGPLVMTEAGLDIQDASIEAILPGADLAFSLDTTGEEHGVRMDGSVGGVALTRGALWSPPHLFEEYPYGWLSMVYPAFAGGKEGHITAGWTDESRTSVMLSTQRMAAFSSQLHAGYWTVSVALSGEGGTVTERTLHNLDERKYPIDQYAHPAGISDEEAVNAARVAAKLLTAAEDYYSRYINSVSDAPAPPSPGPAVTPAPEGGALPFSSPMRLDFSSGAGGWWTELLLYPDGSFEGSYQDSDMGDGGGGYPYGTQYVCQFHGRFGEIAKVTDASWSLVLEELVLDTGRPIGDEWIEGGVRYVSSGPYGLTGPHQRPLEPGAKFMFYTPGARGYAPGDELYGMRYDGGDYESIMAQFWSWWPNRREWTSYSDTLGCYGLCSMESGFGFFSY